MGLCRGYEDDVDDIDITNFTSDAGNDLQRISNKMIQNWKHSGNVGRRKSMDQGLLMHVSRKSTHKVKLSP
jgi:hypothetical protein